MGLFDDLIPAAPAPAPAPVPAPDAAPAPVQVAALDPVHRDLVIRTVLGEAGKEPDEGQSGVAAVIKNRLASGKFGSAIPDVVLAKNQFEPWSTRDGRARMMSYAPDGPEYQRAAANVDRVFGEEGFDPTEGATHFFSPTAQAALGREPPKWAQGDPVAIGRHNFYAPDGIVSATDIGAQSKKPSAAEPTAEAKPVVKTGGGLFDDLIPAGGAQATTPAAVDPVAAAKTEIAKKLSAGSPNMDEVRRAGGIRDTGRDDKQLAGQFLRGVPVLGAFTDQAGGAISAAAQPVTGVGAEGDTFAERYAENKANEKADREGYEKDHPVLSTAAQLGGGVASMVPLGANAIGARALGITGGALPARMATSALVNSGLGAADSAARGEDATTGGMVGGIAGGIAPAASSLLGRFVSPVAARSPAHAALVDTLRAEGVNPTAGQATGSRALRWAEGQLGDLPGAGNAAVQQSERQGEQFTRAALRRAGTDAPRATAEVMDQTAQRIGNEFERLSAGNTLRMDTQFGNDLGNVLNQYDRVLPSQQREIVQNVVDDIIAHGRTMPGEAYQEARSRLSRLSHNARQSDPTYAEALAGVRDALDNAMGRSISGADREAWNTARRQWGNYRLLERAVSGAGEGAAEGLISPSALRNAAATRNRSGYVRGQGDMTELARAGEGVMRPLPNSGTASRSAVGHMMASVAGAAVGGGAAGASSGDPVTGGLGALAGAVAPGLAGRVLLSRPAQAYLGNQVAHTPQGQLARAALTQGAANEERRRLSRAR